MAKPALQQVLSKLKLYPHPPLQWNNFKKVNKAPNGSTFEAQVSATIDPRPGAITLDKGVYRFANLVVDVNLNFDDTWVLANPQFHTQELLVHERGHHNIACLLGRDLCRSLLALEFDPTDPQAETLEFHEVAAPISREAGKAAERVLGKKSARLVEEAFRLNRTLNGAAFNGEHRDGVYDHETDHSKNKPAQQKWNDIMAYAFASDVPLTWAMQHFAVSMCSASSEPAFSGSWL